MIKRSFHTCRLWKGRKVNKNQDPLSKSFVAHCIFVLRLLGDKACGTLIDLSHLRVFDRKTESRRSVSRPYWAASTHVHVLDHFSRLLFAQLQYLVCYNVKLHVIVVTIAARSPPSSSVTWLAEVSKFSSHACSIARAHLERSQNGKEERKLWSCQPCRFWFVLL